MSGDRQIYGVTEDYREDVLRWASSLTINPADPVAVHANALPLLAWLDAADDPADLRARFKALYRHDMNMAQAARVRPTDADDPRPTDDPDAFVAGAKVLHAFLTTGGTA